MNNRIKSYTGKEVNMVIHNCQDCERSFIAVSHDEAEKAYKSQVEQGKLASVSFQHAVDTGEIAYARFCPYCGGTAVVIGGR